MERKKIKSATVTNIILIMISLVACIVAFNQYTDKKEIENKIDELQEQLETEQGYNKLYTLTKEFIEKLSNVEHYDMLTGSAKEDLEKALEQAGKNVDYHSHSLIEKMEIQNVFAVKTEEKRGESYAIYRVYYGNNPNGTPIEQQQITTLSLHAKWEKTKDTYKVYQYEVHLLKDSLDEYLQELHKDYQERQEGEGKNE